MAETTVTGIGTQDDPYLIETCDQFLEMFSEETYRNFWREHFFSTTLGRYFGNGTNLTIIIKGTLDFKGKILNGPIYLPEGATIWGLSKDDQKKIYKQGMSAVISNLTIKSNILFMPFNEYFLYDVNELYKFNEQHLPTSNYYLTTYYMPYQTEEEQKNHASTHSGLVLEYQPRVPEDCAPYYNIDIKYINFDNIVFMPDELLIDEKKVQICPDNNIYTFYESLYFDSIKDNFDLTKQPNYNSEKIVVKRGESGFVEKSPYNSEQITEETFYVNSLTNTIYTKFSTHYLPSISFQNCSLSIFISNKNRGGNIGFGKECSRCFVYLCSEKSNEPTLDKNMPALITTDLSSCKAYINNDLPNTPILTNIVNDNYKNNFSYISKLMGNNEHYCPIGKGTNICNDFSNWNQSLESFNEVPDENYNSDNEHIYFDIGTSSETSKGRIIMYGLNENNYKPLKDSSIILDRMPGNGSVYFCNEKGEDIDESIIQNNDTNEQSQVRPFSTIKNSLSSLFTMSRDDKVTPHILGNCAYASNLKTVIIPTTCKKIGAGAFYKTNLTKVKIPKDCLYYPTSFPPECEIEFYESNS